jgi:hypothetical protein
MVAVEGHVRLKAGRVREQVSDRDGDRALIAPAADVLRNRIVERENPSFDVSHDERRRGKDLGQGGEIEDGVVGRWRRVGFKREPAEGFAPEGPLGVANFDCRSRKRAIR